jgi:deoxyribose-phosphate aldolase
MELNKYIDHTNLKPQALEDDIRRLCEEAREHDFASVCVNPCDIPMAKELLEGSSVKVCTVIGFPLGRNLTATKVAETEAAYALGCDEFDMVINVGELKAGNSDYLIEEIKAIKAACDGKILKVIIETCLLNEAEKIEMCRVVSVAGADYIKTSTGFSTGGATREDVALMRANVAPEVKVKAAGGISSIEDAEDFVKLGADRLGTSRIVKIVKGQSNIKGY